MKTVLFALVVCLLFISTTKSTVNSFRVAFYNCENFFDTLDDPHKNDNDFTPQGNRRWNSYKYYRKKNNLAKVINAIGEWNMPAIVGLCEIENSMVLEDLCANSLLGKFDYNFIHHESPDRRGIDVALLYRTSQVKVIEDKTFTVIFPESPNSRTRDILYAKVVLQNILDTLHIFVNHWPSRYGGHLETDAKRNYVAGYLNEIIHEVGIEKKILIMGDFNDAPLDQSLKDYLKSGNYNDQSNLINLMTSYQEAGEGTHFHKGITEAWLPLDQMIVSRTLYEDNKGMSIKNQEAKIFRKDWLLNSETSAPFRTYLGFKYAGGFSDHLPVYLDIVSDGQ